MDKTTVYLPPELKSAVKRAARRRGVSEAEVIRESIRDAVGGERPQPRGGLFRTPLSSQNGWRDLWDMRLAGQMLASLYRWFRSR